MRSYNLSWRNARGHKFAWRGSIILKNEIAYCPLILLSLYPFRVEHQTSWACLLAGFRPELDKTLQDTGVCIYTRLCIHFHLYCFLGFPSLNIYDHLNPIMTKLFYSIVIRYLCNLLPIVAIFVISRQFEMTCNCFSPDLDKDMQKYWSMDEHEAADTFSPLLFIGFPSAKDPSWESRYPGNTLMWKIFSYSVKRWLMITSSLNYTLTKLMTAWVFKIRFMLSVQIPVSKKTFIYVLNLSIKNYQYKLL